MADDLDWWDKEMVEQVCGGGIDPSPDIELCTVLAFHHPSTTPDYSITPQQRGKQSRKGGSKAGQIDQSDTSPSSRVASSLETSSSRIDTN